MADTENQNPEGGPGTTGHEWDGIREFDNPLPRWWLWIFYATVLWSVVYMVFMPAVPAPPGMEGYTKGLREHSERKNVAAAMKALQDSRSVFYEKLEAASLADIEADPELFRFALAAGKSAFGDNCATCHGEGAQGAPGYPNLNDDVWLWGGTFEDIRTTLQVGIRSSHEETRYSEMPAFGRDEIYSDAQIRDLTEYVLQLSGQDADAAKAAAGAPLYAEQCVACHMEDGTGDRLQGSPDLTDRDWLYGGDRETIYRSIWRGPKGVMPAWSERLDAATIAALATYVHSLGGGETAEPEAAKAPGTIEVGSAR